MEFIRSQRRPDKDWGLTAKAVGGEKGQEIIVESGKGQADERQDEDKESTEASESSSSQVLSILI